MTSPAIQGRRQLLRDGNREIARQVRRANNLSLSDAARCEALINAYRNAICRYGPHVQFAVTLHSKFVPGEPRSLLAWQTKQLVQQFHHVSNRVNAAIYGKGYKRNPDQHRLMMIPVIQGSAFDPLGRRTLHYHLALGNVPEHLASEHVHEIFRNAWKTVPAAQDNVLTKPADPGWQTYITGEMDDGIVDYVDIDNWFIPSWIEATLS
jgi:hypothetical protein